MLSKWAIRGVLVSLAMAVCPAAKAATVTFDDAFGNSNVFHSWQIGESFSDGGLTFTNDSGIMYIWSGSSPGGNGTNSNLFGNMVQTGYETITRTGGGNFDLYSIDLSISFYATGPLNEVTINGVPLPITSVSTTYILNLVGVSEVKISSVATHDGYWSADNLVWSAATASTPVPAALPLFATGLVGLGWLGRRRRGKTRL